MKTRDVGHPSDSAAADKAVRTSWARRVAVGTFGTAGATIALAAFAASAFANAANPLPDSHGTISSAGGTAVRVDVGGTWNWGALSGSSTQSDCDKRYGVGYAVDWWGINSGGTAINGLKGQVAVTTGGTPSLTEQSLSPNVALVNKSKTVTFHASNLLNGFDPNLCAHKDAQGFPEGPWSTYAIYPDAASVPNLICVNMYDLHGSPGNPQLGDFTSHNGDNSVEKNDFDPAVNAGYCFHPVFQHPLSMDVAKVNDADQDGTFSKTETAKSAGQAVDFKVTITNNSQQAVAVIDGPITDEFTGTTINVCNGTNGTNVIGTELNPLDKVTCTFSVSNYAPAINGADKVNTVTVNVHEKGLPANTASGQSSSTVVAAAGAPKIEPGKKGPATGDLNGNGTYTLTATNTGNVGSAATTIIDVLPTGESFVQAGSSAACSAVGQTVTCTVDPLAAGAHQDFTVVVTYTKTGNLEDCAHIDGQLVTACVTTEVGAPKLEPGKKGPATGDLNGNGTYTLTVKNTGNRPSLATTIIDVLPTGETFVVNGSSNACSAVGQTVTCTVGPLAAGASQDFTVVVTYTKTGNLEDCAHIDGQLVTACVTTEVGEPKLEPQKKGPATGLLNGNGTYTLTVTNTGNRPSTATTIIDVLPAGESFVANGSSNACSAVGQTVTCTVGPLAAGAHQDFTVVVTYTKTGLLTDCAHINGQLVEKCVTTNIPGNPALTVVKTNDADGDGVFHDSENAADEGDAVTFKVVVTNTSAVPVVIDSITDVFGTTSVGQCANLLGTVLASGQSVTCTFTIEGYAPAAGSSLLDTVTVIGHEDGVPGNSTQGADTSTVTTVVPPPGPDLAIVKSATPDTVEAGDTLTYTLAVTNVGDGPTTGTITVTDQIPNGLDLVSVGGTDWDCTADGRAITCVYTGGALAAGASAPDITVVTTVNDTAFLRVINTGVVKTPGDVNPSNDESTVETPVTRVLGERETPQAPPEVLPFTGSNTGSMLPVGMLMVLLGGLFLAAARRRRHG